VVQGWLLGQPMLLYFQNPGGYSAVAPLVFEGLNKELGREDTCIATDYHLSNKDKALPAHATVLCLRQNVRSRL
jgi:hypothetical protein